MSGNLKTKAKSSTTSALSVSKLLEGTRFADLTRVPIDYIIEVWEEGKIQQTITLPNTPESFEVERPSAATMRFTLGDLPIRQIKENKVREIQLTGRSGLQARQGHTRKGTQKYAPGPELLLEFDGFLQDYSERLEKSLIASKKAILTPQDKNDKTYMEKQPYMVLRALNEKLHLRIEPVNWSWRRSADTSRLSYEWKLGLKAYGYAPQGGPKSIFAPADAFMAEVGDAINRVATEIGVLDNVVNNTRGDIKNLVSPALGALRNITNAMQKLSASTNQLLLLPKSIFANLVATAVSFERACTRFSNTVNPFDKDLYRPEVEALKNLFNGLSNEALSTSYKALGVSGGGPSDVARAQSALAASDVSDGGLGLGNSTDIAGDLGGRASSLEVYVIRQGDTLQNLAERVLGSADRWTDIANANGMGGLHDAGPTGTLVPGTRILLPTNFVSGENAGVFGAASVDELLGTDLRVDLSTGDILLVGGNEVRTLRGSQNLEQALAIRLLTENATLPLFPNYGLPLRPGVGMTSRTATYCGVHCQDQVLSDPRVLEVRDISVEDGGDSIDVLMNIVPVNGGSLEIITPMRAKG